MQTTLPVPGCPLPLSATDGQFTLGHCPRPPHYKRGRTADGGPNGVASSQIADGRSPKSLGGRLAAPTGSGSQTVKTHPNSQRRSGNSTKLYTPAGCMHPITTNEPATVTKRI